MIDIDHNVRHHQTVLKVPLHIVEGRRRELAAYVQSYAYAPLREVCVQFKISTATARRDLAALEARKEIVRTYGGALTEHNRRFPSFRERETRQARAKHRIARAAHTLIEPHSNCFLDFGTTAFALAKELRSNPIEGLHILTNSLPVAELLADTAAMRVHLLGGEILPRQSALLGAAACKAVKFYSIHLAFMSAEAADRTGIWNSQSDVTEFQRAVLAKADRTILCLDGSKFKHTAPAFLAPWAHFDLLITNRTAGKIDFAECEQSFV